MRGDAFRGGADGVLAGHDGRQGGIGVARGQRPPAARAVELTLWHSWSNDSEMAALKAQLAALQARLDGMSKG